MSDKSELTAGQRKMQELLVHLTETIDIMNDVALENHIARVDFMGTCLVFGTDWDDDSWASDWLKKRANIRTNFSPLPAGPAMTDEYWSASTFSCWPNDKQKTLVFGTDETKWPKTSYEDDDY